MLLVLVLETFFFPFSVNLPTAQRAFAMRSSFKVLQFPFRSVCTHCSQCSSVRSYWVKNALRNRLAFFHLHCHSELQTDFTYFFKSFFLAFVKDEYFYTLKSKKTYQDQTTRSTYEIQNKKFGSNLKNNLKGSVTNKHF